MFLLGVTILVMCSFWARSTPQKLAHLNSREMQPSHWSKGARDKTSDSHREKIKADLQRSCDKVDDEERTPKCAHTNRTATGERDDEDAGSGSGIAARGSPTAVQTGRHVSRTRRSRETSFREQSPSACSRWTLRRRLSRQPHQ